MTRNAQTQISDTLIKYLLHTCCKLKSVAPQLRRRDRCKIGGFNVGGKRLTAYIVVGDYDDKDAARTRGFLRDPTYHSSKFRFYHQARWRCATCS